MSYETGSASNIQDLMDKLETFAVANGWTSDHSASGRLMMTRSTLSVAFRWATSSPTCVAIYQHLAFINSGTDPGNHTDDSGQGAISSSNATLLTGRHVLIADSVMQYWFFESDTYIHIVVEPTTQQFRHFGFGILNKLGTWTGGEYSYGDRHTTTGTASLAVTLTSSWLLDGLSSGATTTVYPFCAVMHMEGMPNQTASGKWGIVWGGTSSVGNDRAAVARANVQGGFRGGSLPRAYGRYGGAITNGLNPMYTIECFYDDPSTTRWYPLGTMPDVRGFSIRNYSGGDEITVGSDVWVVFPARYKTDISNNGGTRMLGIAYKKVTT